jgi:hypothetical protein
MDFSARELPLERHAAEFIPLCREHSAVFLYDRAGDVNHKKSFRDPWLVTRGS